MNQSTECAANYSQMVIPQKKKLKKKMFAKIKDEPKKIQIKPKDNDTGKFHESDEEDGHDDHQGNDIGDNQQLRENRRRNYHAHKTSFEIEEKERQCLQLSEKGNLWIILALLAGVCYAFNNFFLGQLSHHGLVAVIYVNIPSFCLFLVVYAINFIRNKIVHGIFWSREISIFFREEDNSLDFSMILGVVLMAVCKFMAFCLVVVTFHFAIAAGMNLGIITVLFNFCCITDSVVFYFVFKEKLSKGQLVGSGVLLLSAFLIAQNPGKQTVTYPRHAGETDLQYEDRIEQIETYHTYNASLAILTALCSTLFFSARDVILRYYKIYKKYPAFELSLDSLTIYSFGCCSYAVYLFGFQGYQFDWNSFSAGCMSAVLNTLGFMMLGISVVIGYAGPANALNSIQAVVLTLLSVMIMNQIPTGAQTIGMIMGMVGTIIVSTGDALINFLTMVVRFLRGTQPDTNEDHYRKLIN